VSSFAAALPALQSGVAVTGAVGAGIVGAGCGPGAAR
jgi:hypothetical protein